MQLGEGDADAVQPVMRSADAAWVVPRLTRIGVSGRDILGTIDDASCPPGRNSLWTRFVVCHEPCDMLLRACSALWTMQRGEESKQLVGIPHPLIHPWLRNVVVVPDVMEHALLVLGVTRKLRQAGRQDYDDSARQEVGAGARVSRKGKCASRSAMKSLVRSGILIGFPRELHA